MKKNEKISLSIPWGILNAVFKGKKYGHKVQVLYKVLTFLSNCLN